MLVNILLLIFYLLWFFVSPIRFKIFDKSLSVKIAFITLIPIIFAIFLLECTRYKSVKVPRVIFCGATMWIIRGAIRSYCIDIILIFPVWFTGLQSWLLIFESDKFTVFLTNKFMHVTHLIDHLLFFSFALGLMRL